MASGQPGGPRSRRPAARGALGRSRCGPGGFWVLQHGATAALLPGHAARGGRAQRFNTVLNFRLHVGPWVSASAARPDGRFRTRLSALLRPNSPGSRPFSRRGRLDRGMRLRLEPQRFDGRCGHLFCPAARRPDERGLDRLSYRWYLDSASRYASTACDYGGTRHETHQDRQRLRHLRGHLGP